MSSKVGRCTYCGSRDVRITEYAELCRFCAESNNQTVVNKEMLSQLFNVMLKELHPDASTKSTQG